MTYTNYSRVLCVSCVIVFVCGCLWLCVFVYGEMTNKKPNKIGRYRIEYGVENCVYTIYIELTEFVWKKKHRHFYYKQVSICVSVDFFCVWLILPAKLLWKCFSYLASLICCEWFVCNCVSCVLSFVFYIFLCLHSICLDSSLLISKLLRIKSLRSVKIINSFQWRKQKE